MEIAKRELAIGSHEEDPESKKPKVDSGSGSDSDGSSVSAGSESEWAEYRIQPDKEPPEWDVDSFDGREFKINPRIRRLYKKNQDLYDEYYQERFRAFQSKGFIADPLSGIYESYLTDSSLKFMEELAKLCVKKYNDTNEGKTLEFDEIVRVNESGLTYTKLYITFWAIEYSGGPRVEYQAKVIYYPRDRPPYPILCRPSPTQPDSY